MEQYNYRAIDENDIIVTGTIHASGRDDAIRVIKERRLVLISLKKQSVWSMDVSDLFNKNKFLPAKTLSLLASQLYFMLDSGILVHKAFSALQNQIRDSRLNGILQLVSSQTLTGKTLTDAFCAAACFPPFFVSMVEIGEKSGKLPSVFHELADYYEWEDDCRREINTAMQYPAIVAVALFAVIIITVTSVAPAYARIYASGGTPLPLPTKILMVAGNFITRYGAVISLICALLLIFLFMLSKTTRYRIFTERFRFSLPILKTVYRHLFNYRFARITSMLLEAGFHLTVALERTVDILDYPFLEHEFQNMSNGVNKGVALNVLMARIKYFDPMLVSMVETGEETGRLPEMMKLASKHIKTRMLQATARMNHLIEPLITIVMGLVVGFVMLAVVLPSFSLLNVF